MTAPATPPGYAFRQGSPPFALFAHPLPVLALVVLVVNDHLAKGAGVLPDAFTGKASDVAGLFVFPLVLSSLANGLVPRARPVPLTAVGAALTAAVFAAMKTVPFVNAFACHLLGPTELDPSDLLTLPACAASLVFVAHVVRRETPSAVAGGRVLALHRAAVAVAAVACLATSRPSRPRDPEPPNLDVASSRCVRVVLRDDSPREDLDSVTATVTATEPCTVDLVAELRTEQGPATRAIVTSAPQHLELAAGATRDVVFELRLPLVTGCETPRTVRVFSSGTRRRAPLADGTPRCKPALPLAVPGSAP